MDKSGYELTSAQRKKESTGIQNEARKRDTERLKTRVKSLETVTKELVKITKKLLKQHEQNQRF